MNHDHHTLRIGLLGYDQANALDISGPMEAFGSANAAATAQQRPAPYQLLVIAATPSPFTTESGLAVAPQYTFANAPPLDTVIVPGGCGLRRDATCEAVVDWLRTRATDCRRVVSVCTGLYGLAATGWLDGRRATSHWRHVGDLQARFPALQLDADSIYIKDGRYYTSAGVTAGIDLALALIEEDLGAAIALAAARDLLVYMKRPGGQAQYSEPLRLQTQSPDRFGELAAWIAAHPGQDLSLEALAARVCLSPRQFSRRFRAAFGCSPGEYVETQRLGVAREQLTHPRASVEHIARASGFGSADVFRRAFERRYGVSPGDYRRRFVSQAATSAVTSAITVDTCR